MFATLHAELALTTLEVGFAKLLQEAICDGTTVQDEVLQCNIRHNAAGSNGGNMAVYNSECVTTATV